MNKTRGQTLLPQRTGASAAWGVTYVSPSQSVGQSNLASVIVDECDLSDRAVHDREENRRDHTNFADSRTAEEPLSAQDRTDDDEEQRTGTCINH